MRAAELVEEATRLAAELLGQGSLLADSWLDKLYRDAQAFEFMEKRKHPPVGGFPECPQGKR